MADETIEPLPESPDRPFWSVMIPTYNRTDYLGEAIESVLAQDPGPDQMQIEVVDNDSTRVDVQSFVRRVAGDRVGFFRQPKNIGMAGNWNTCVRRARGRWVHILHDDDSVRPGFYTSLQCGLASSPEAGLAYCRHAYVNGAKSLLVVSDLERPDPGLLPDFDRHIAVRQRIQCPAVVVRRRAYEAMGGFRRCLYSTADWEMWRRVASRYPVWYEPQVLADYRQHGLSDTSRMMRFATNIADARRCIEYCKRYLPPDVADELTLRAREGFAHVAIDTMEYMLFGGAYRSAANQAIEAIRCRAAPPVLRRLAVAAGWAFARHVKHGARKMLRDFRAA